MPACAFGMRSGSMEMKKDVGVRLMDGRIGRPGAGNSCQGGRWECMEELKMSLVDGVRV